MGLTVLIIIISEEQLFQVVFIFDDFLSNKSLNNEICFSGFLFSDLLLAYPNECRTLNVTQYVQHVSCLLLKPIKFILLDFF